MDTHFAFPELCILESEMIRKTCVMVVAYYVGMLSRLHGICCSQRLCFSVFKMDNIFSSYAAPNYACKSAYIQLLSSF